jgi:hypothetical protein
LSDGLNCRYFQSFPKETRPVQDQGLRLPVGNETAKQTCSVKRTFFLIQERGVLMLELNETAPQFSVIKRIMTILFVVDRTTYEYFNDLNV